MMCLLAGIKLRSCWPVGTTSQPESGRRNKAFVPAQLVPASRKDPPGFHVHLVESTLALVAKLLRVGLLWGLPAVCGFVVKRVHGSEIRSSLEPTESHGRGDTRKTANDNCKAVGILFSLQLYCIVLITTLI